MTGQNGPTEGRLRSRPAQEVVGTAAPIGLQSLGLGVTRGDYLLHVPETYQTASPAPLMLWLHGAGGRAHAFLTPEQQGRAEAAGMLLLVPTSKEYTWDVIVRRGRYGPDVAAIDRALDSTFGRYAVDPTRIAVGGFSDGASYALSLGITNGDLFTQVLAFSPGFMMPAGQRGSPRVFVSHGTRDEVLPIERCSRRIVPQLRRAGYDIRYREFDGGHAVPLDIAREVVGWFAAGQGARDRR
jgi:phospholipase/carboxylesterase